MADDPAASAKEAEQSQDLDSLAERQDRVERKLDEVIGLLRPKGGGGSPPGGPTSPGGNGGGGGDGSDSSPSIEEQVQAELDRRDKKAADDKAAADDKSEREQMKADLAALRETKPQAPVRRATRLLGWGDGRR